MERLPGPVIHGSVHRLILHIPRTRLDDPSRLIIEYYHESYIDQEGTHGLGVWHGYARVDKVHHKDYEEDDRVFDQETRLGFEFVEKIEPGSTREDEARCSNQ